VNGKHIPGQLQQRSRATHLRALWGLVAATAVGAAAYVEWGRGSLPAPGQVTEHTASLYEQHREWSLRLPGRLVYPYSVVPGGVSGASEIEQAVAADPVVAEHYRGFVYRHAMAVTLAEPKLSHVSYRVKDRIYYTRKKLLLARGERVITDGKSMIRARCGNRLMDAPPAQTSLLEPPDDVFNSPELPPVSLLDFPEYPPAGAPPGEVTPVPVELPPALLPPGVVPPGLISLPTTLFPPMRFMAMARHSWASLLREP